MRANGLKMHTHMQIMHKILSRCFPDNLNKLLGHYLKAENHNQCSISRFEGKIIVGIINDARHFQLPSPIAPRDSLKRRSKSFFNLFFLPLEGHESPQSKLEL